MAGPTSAPAGLQKYSSLAGKLVSYGPLMDEASVWSELAELPPDQVTPKLYETLLDAEAKTEAALAELNRVKGDLLSPVKTRFERILHSGKDPNEKLQSNDDDFDDDVEDEDDVVDESVSDIEADLDADLDADLGGIDSIDDDEDDIEHHEDDSDSEASRSAGNATTRRKGKKTAKRRKAETVEA